MRLIPDFVDNFFWTIGVDLGTDNILIYLKERGVVIDEPAMVTIIKRKRWMGLGAPRQKLLRSVAFGFKAKEMLNREPQQLEVISPVSRGIVSDLEVTENMLAYYLKLIYEVPNKYPKLLKSRVVAGIPLGISEVQMRAFRGVFWRGGVARVTLIEQPILAAIGAGWQVTGDKGMMVVDLGGGKTEIAVVAHGGVVVGKSLEVGGDDLDVAIINYIKMRYNLLIGKNSAEKIKKEVGNVGEKGGKLVAVVRGRDVESGLPRSVKIGSEEIKEAVALLIAKIVRAVKEVMDETPSELMEDILKRGIVLSGGGARLRGIDEVMERETKTTVEVVDDPELGIVKGLGEVIDNPKIGELVAKLAIVK